MVERISARSDAQLLDAARGGDKDALQRLLQRHQAQVYRFGLKMCRDPEDAQDVLQETLLAMARSVRDFRGASSLSTWLYTVARSFCIKKRRRSQFAPRETSLEVYDEAPGAAVVDPAASSEDQLAGKQLEAALERAIRSLEPKYREVLLLRDVEELTAPEVAEIVGISVQAVKSRLHRARVMVRDNFAPALGLPSDTSSAIPTCPDVVTLFSKHLENEISTEVCSTMQGHLEQCALCRVACDSLKETLSRCRKSKNPAGAVPASVQAAVKRALREFLAETG